MATGATAIRGSIHVASLGAGFAALGVALILLSALMAVIALVRYDVTLGVSAFDPARLDRLDEDEATRVVLRVYAAAVTRNQRAVARRSFLVDNALRALFLGTAFLAAAIVGFMTRGGV